MPRTPQERNKPRRTTRTCATTDARRSTRDAPAMHLRCGLEPPPATATSYHARCTRIRKQGTRKSAMPLPPGGGRPLPALPRTHALDTQARPASPPPYRPDRAGAGPGPAPSRYGHRRAGAVCRGWLRAVSVPARLYAREQTRVALARGRVCGGFIAARCGHPCGSRRLRAPTASGRGFGLTK
jgi:hypothetical protein